jgi:hypothetical protein
MIYLVTYKNISQNKVSNQLVIAKMRVITRMEKQVQMDPHLYALDQVNTFSTKL